MSLMSNSSKLLQMLLKANNPVLGGPWLSTRCPPPPDRHPLGSNPCRVRNLRVGGGKECVEFTVPARAFEVRSRPLLIAIFLVDPRSLVHPPPQILGEITCPRNLNKPHYDFSGFHADNEKVIGGDNNLRCQGAMWSCFIG